MPRVIHCILNDLSYEQRAHKIALTLSTRYEVLLVGIATIRKRRPVPKRPYSVRRLFVPVEGGMLFFFLANVRLFLYLLFLRRWDGVVVADLDALLGCYWAARLRGKKVILDSRELYPALPSLYGRPLKRWIWSKVEAWLCPKVRYHFTVSPPIAQYYKERYGINAWLIYNMPLRQRGFAKARLEDKLLFYQGVLHPYRGLEEVILALRMVPGWRLWIAGDGKHRAYLGSHS
jgi:glycosyltransferase involved in cell wall biosynthesis